MSTQPKPLTSQECRQLATDIRRELNREAADYLRGQPAPVRDRIAYTPEQIARAVAHISKEGTPCSA